MKQPAYRAQYGTKRPMIISTFSKFGENEHVSIIYSHGSTESKAHWNDNLVFDLVLTGKTLRANTLKIIASAGKTINNIICVHDRGMLNKPKIQEFIKTLEDIKRNDIIF